MAEVRFVYSPKYQIDIGPHVFPTQKYVETYKSLWNNVQVKESDFFPPEDLSYQDLMLVHTPEYIDDLKNARWTHRTAWSELPISKEIIEGFKLMTGGTWKATKLAIEHGIGFHIGGGFHHAYPDHAEGFCYINDLAVAIRLGQKNHFFERALVVDCDLHQGNGTAGIFKNDQSVFTFSIHQENNYPVPKDKSDLDIGLPDGIEDEEYLTRLSDALDFINKSFNPEILFYQAGADPYEGDQLGGLHLSKRGLKERDKLVIEFGLSLNIPVVITLGGGYAYKLSDTVEIHVNTALVALELAKTRSNNAHQET